MSNNNWIETNRTALEAVYGGFLWRPVAQQLLADYVSRGGAWPSDRALFYEVGARIKGATRRLERGAPTLEDALWGVEQAILRDDAAPYGVSADAWPRIGPDAVTRAHAKVMRHVHRYPADAIHFAVNPAALRAFWVTAKRNAARDMFKLENREFDARATFLLGDPLPEPRLAPPSIEAGSPLLPRVLMGLVAHARATYARWLRIVERADIATRTRTQLRASLATIALRDAMHARLDERLATLRTLKALCDDGRTARIVGLPLEPARSVQAFDRNVGRKQAQLRELLVCLGEPPPAWMT